MINRTAIIKYKQTILMLKVQSANVDDDADVLSLVPTRPNVEK